MTFREGKARAIIIGINSYCESSAEAPNQPKISALQGAEYDAEHLARVLVTFGEFEDIEKGKNLLLGSEATRYNIRKALSSVFLKDSEPYEVVLFYFSGHGFRDGYGNGYLAPWDMERDDPLANGIRMSELDQIISDYYKDTENSSKTTVMLILDCCYSGIATKGPASVYEDAKDQLKGLQGQGRIILASSRPDQVSRETPNALHGTENTKHWHGKYTSQILKALEGGPSCPPASQNGIITFADLQSFLEKNRADQSQEPTVKIEGQAPLSTILTFTKDLYEKDFAEIKFRVDYQLQNPNPEDMDLLILNEISRLLHPLKGYVAEHKQWLEDKRNDIKRILQGYYENVGRWLNANRVAIMLASAAPEYPPSLNKILAQKLKTIQLLLKYDSFVGLRRDTPSLNFLYEVCSCVYNNDFKVLDTPAKQESFLDNCLLLLEPEIKKQQGPAQQPPVN